MNIPLPKFIITSDGYLGLIGYRYVSIQKKGVTMDSLIYTMQLVTPKNKTPTPASP